jgi:hypothetical protein
LKREGAKSVTNFVLLYKGGGELPATPEAQQIAMEAWGAWFGSIAASMVDSGNPFGPSASSAANGASTNGTNSGYTGYSVIAADDLVSAVAKSKSCPILANGDSVDIFETFNIM